MSHSNPNLFRDPRRWMGFITTAVAASALFASIPVEQNMAVGVGHWTSLLPPLIAVLMAIFFRKLLLALSSAVMLGAFLAFWPTKITIGAPIIVVAKGFDSFILKNLFDPSKIYILLFTFALVGMVQVMSRTGGVRGMVNIIVRFAKTPRSTRVATALMGLVIFFDDYANSVVVGTTMRKLTDERGISREKLAYIVDSTAAPVSGIALISTWIAYEVGLFNDISQSIGLGKDGYDIFLSILPFRFYCIAALIFVFVGSFSGRDFGPMLKAERRAFYQKKPLADDAKPLANEAFDSIEPPKGKPQRAINAILPIVAVVFAVIFGMLFDGKDAVIANNLPFDITASITWRTAFGDASSGKILFWASMFGSAIAIGLGVQQKIVSFSDAFKNWLKALPAMKLAVGILILAWAINSVCGELNTAGFLSESVRSVISLPALPLVTFLLAGAIAFATGTSWGTMGILLPMALPLAFSLSDAGPHDTMIMWLVASAVLDGAIFGDHCSPISDTTVLSSIASGSDHLHHVKTQLPYAVTTMLIAAGFGYVGVAFGLTPILAYPAILISTVVVFYVIGRNIQAPVSS